MDLLLLYCFDTRAMTGKNNMRNLNLSNHLHWQWQALDPSCHFGKTANSYFLVDETGKISAVINVDDSIIILLSLITFH